jgi:hypothetical protein
MKLYFIKGDDGYDEYDPILVLADSKEEAESFANKKEMFTDNAPNMKGKAGRAYTLKKEVIWRQFNAG